MSGRLLPCPFCGKRPSFGPTKKQYCQLHGKPFQNYAIWCEGHARIVQPHKDAAERVWNSRSNPIPPELSP